MKRTSLVIVLVFMALATGIFYIARTYPEGTTGAMGPGFFPMIIAGIVFLLCLLLLNKIRKQEDDGGVFITKKNALVFLSLLITCVYVAGIGLLGFPIATLLYLFGLMKFFKLKGKIFPALVSICTTGILYSVFTMFLSVQLPRGLLFW